MRVLGLTRQEQGGGYYRMHLPLAAMAANGHKTITAPAHTNVQVDRDAVDVIVGQMIGHAGWWRRLRMSAPLVYELDDDPFEVEPHNPVYGHYSDPLARDRLSHSIAVADLVTVSTEPLAERMRKHNPNVVVLKNRIDGHLLTMDRPRRDKVTIGWAGGASHLEDVKLVARPLGKTLDRHPKVEAHIIGADYRPLVKRPMRYTPWCEKTIDYYKLIDFDIGLAPLKPTVFARTKSFIKALEYAALGIPVIASDVTPYNEFVIDGVTGWLVRRDHEWAPRMRELINDEAMRTEMGTKAREVAAEWTIQKGWSEWATAYQSVI